MKVALGITRELGELCLLYLVEMGIDIIGVDTWMLYIPSENLGIIYFANGNPAYGLTPIIGSISFRFLLYSLFIEGGLNSFNY